MPEITALFTFEILGKPPEHIVETLEKIIKQLGKQKGIEIKNKKIHEPKEIEREGKQQGLFTTFAEVEIKTEDIKMILAITLNMLPAHVEVVSPTDFHLKNFELSSLLTELTIKIHKYDEIAKAILIERNTLLNKIKDAEERCRELEREIKKKTEQSSSKKTDNSKDLKNNYDYAKHNNPR